MVGITIESGAVESRAVNENIRSLLKFENLTYDAAIGCQPTSGTITGELFRIDDGSSITSYKLEFGETLNKIVFADGREITFAADGCTFEWAR